MTVLPLSTTNGTTPQRGRFVMPRHTFTFTSSGITVECHKVSPALFNTLLAAVAKEARAGKHPEHPYPEVPKVKVDVAGEITEEEVLGGELYEKYQKDIRDWNDWAQNEAGLRFLTMVALDYLVLDNEGVTEEVQRMQKALQRQGADLPDLGISLEGYSEAEVARLHFLFSVCMLDPVNDGQAFMGFLIGQAQPREEAIQENIASFRPTRD